MDLVPSVAKGIVRLYIFGIVARNLVIPVGGKPATLNFSFSVKPREQLGRVILEMRAPWELS
jgi:hypothetical protein